MRLWPPRPSAPQALPPERALFVVGAARSGTTILQNMLNHAPQVFLLGEPDLHLDDGAPGFAARYNAMHRGWRNQETKSTWLPPLLADDPGFEAWLARLARSHRWVGAKTVVNPRRDPGWSERFDRFHFGRFHAARYVFTFRDPLAVVRSTQGLQALTGAPVGAAPAALAGYAEVVALYVRALRNLPHVAAVMHEDLGGEGIAALADWLDVPCEGMGAYYDATRVRRYSRDEIDAGHRPLLDLTTTLYEDLRAGAREGFARPQVEQNDNNFSPGHYTPLGSIARRAGEIARIGRETGSD